MNTALDVSTGVDVGYIVISKAGRDKGQKFIVLARDSEFAYIADGDMRKTDAPKKKKWKHLQLTNYKSDFIENKLATAGKVTNAELRKALADYSPV